MCRGISSTAIESQNFDSLCELEKIMNCSCVKEDDFDERYVLWTSLYVGLLKSVFVTEELSPEEANVAYGIGLSVWGVSEAKAKKIVSRPLGLAAVK